MITIQSEVFAVESLAQQAGLLTQVVVVKSTRVPWPACDNCRQGILHVGILAFAAMRYLLVWN